MIRMVFHYSLSNVYFAFDAVRMTNDSPRKTDMAEVGHAAGQGGQPKLPFNAERYTRRPLHARQNAFVQTDCDCFDPSC